MPGQGPVPAGERLCKTPGNRAYCRRTEGVLNGLGDVGTFGRGGSGPSWGPRGVPGGTGRHHAVDGAWPRSGGPAATARGGGLVAGVDDGRRVVSTAGG